MKLREISVSCKWCGARPGEPCKDQKGKPYYGKFHLIRTETYKQALKQKYWEDVWK